jgi:hypothetical protein
MRNEEISLPVKMETRKYLESVAFTVFLNNNDDDERHTDDLTVFPRANVAAS